MSLDKILEHNRAFVRDRSRTAAPLPPPATAPLVVVTCSDPRLDGLLSPALGIGLGEAIVARLPGALVPPGGETLRAIGLAVFMWGATDVIVVGHTSCRMAAFSSASFVEAFRSRGVLREAFGADDLREWAGAIPDPRRGVEISVRAIRSAPFLPAGLRVVGAVLDDTTGSLEVVVRPEQGVVDTRRMQTAEAEHGAGAPGTAPKPTGEPRPGMELPLDGAPAEVAGSGIASALGEALEAFLHAVRTNSSLRHEARQLRAELSRPASPMAKFGLLKAFVAKAGAGSREVVGAFERLRREVARRNLEPEDQLELLERLAGRL